MKELAFLGEWRQVRPSPAPVEIFVRFERDGQLTYVVDGQQRQLTWRIEGDVLIANDIPSSYRFRSPTVLILERENERYVYYRV
jgi:hypothetical protein